MRPTSDRHDEGARVSEQALVTVRHSRWPVVVGWGLTAALEVGLLYALARAVLTDDWAFEGDVGPVGTVLGWAVVVVFTVLLGAAVVLGARLLLVGPLADHVGDSAVWETESGRETTRIELETAASITYLPALRATWQTSGKAVDDRVRWTPAGVGYDRLVVSGRGGASLTFASSGRHWPDVVDALETWTSRVPGLAADEETRAFLSTPFPRPHPWLERLAGTALTMVAVGVAAIWWLHSTGGFVPGLIPTVVIGGVLLGAMSWWVLLRPVAAVVQGVVASVVRRDPWAAFEPDAHGRFNWLLDSRTTILRAPARRSVPGLLWRWPAFVLLGAVAPVLVVFAFSSPFH